MVNAKKVERKLPSLLINGSVQSTDNEYMKTRYRVGKLKQRNPTLFNSLFNNFMVALDELDKEAEKVGFQHIDFDSHGNIITKKKKR